MKIKLLVNINLSQDKLAQGVIKKLSGSVNEEAKSVLILEDTDTDSPSINNFRINRAQTVFNKDKKTPLSLSANPFVKNPFVKNNNLNMSSVNNIINNNNNIYNSEKNTLKEKNIINNFNNDNMKKILNKTKNNYINKNIDLSKSINNNNNNNININNSLKKNEEEDKEDNNNENDELDDVSSLEIINELEKEDNLELMDDNNIIRYTEMKDPYTNIKEEELNRLLNLKEDNESYKIELEEGENKIDNFSCSVSNYMMSRGNLLVTTKKVEFYSSIFKKIQIIIPLKDIISIKKSSYLGIDTAIQINTEKVSHLFTSFLFRDQCYSILTNEIKRVKEELKKEKNNNKEEEKVDLNSPEQKYLGKKRFKAKQISKMLEEINFYEKLKEITNARMELFTKLYTDEKKGFFIPQKTFKRKYAEEIFKDCPLFIPFTILCKMTTKLEEYKKDKGFFESLFLNRGDTEVKFSENPEFSKNIPNFFDNGDYVMNLFSQFNKEDFENFLNEMQNWSHKYECTCHAVHKVKQVPFGPSQIVMKDRFIAYFISPTLLIFDDMAYATEFTFCDNFLPLFRYTFDCDIKFNDKKGKFEFNTKMTITYITIFLANFMLKGAVETKSNSDTEELIKGEIIDKVKDSLNLYIDRFKDIFDRITDETFQRKIDLKQNMITGEIEEDVIEGEMADEKEAPEDNNNEIKENENNDKKDENDKNENLVGIHQKINEFIEKYKLYIMIGIIAIIVIGILLSLFNSSKEKGSLLINTIFNLMILGAIFYLFKFK